MVGEGEGDGQLWGSGRGAIAGCHCSVLWWGKGRVTANFGGVDVVCHCSVLWWGKGRVTANFGGVDVVPLEGAFVVCYGWVPVWRPTMGGVDVVPWAGFPAHQWHPERTSRKNCLELLADVTLFSTLITQKLVLLSGVYAGIILCCFAAFAVRSKNLQRKRH